MRDTRAYQEGKKDEQDLVSAEELRDHLSVAHENLRDCQLEALYRITRAKTLTDVQLSGMPKLPPDTSKLHSVLIG